MYADENFTGSAEIYNVSIWAIKDTAIKVNNGNVKIRGGVLFQSGKAGMLIYGGNGVFSGVATNSRSLADLIAYKGAKSICAYGNLTVKPRNSRRKTALLKAETILNSLKPGRKKHGEF